MKTVSLKPNGCKNAVPKPTELLAKPENIDILPRPARWAEQRALFTSLRKMFLLDLNRATFGGSVTYETEYSMIDLRDLCLADARALLEHDPSNKLPDQQESPLAYLQGIIDGLCDISLTDPLTGLGNRRNFRRILNREVDVVARSGESALLLMLDIDFFKKVNDTYGHHAGDQVLHAVGKCLTSCVRPMDTVARYGGEEFAVILPSCQSSFGRMVAERIRESVQALSVSVAPLVNLQVTISIGGAYAPEWVRSTADMWTERADQQLYKAKSEGRNRVCIEEQAMIAVSAEEKSLLFGHLSLGEPAWIESAPGSAPTGITGNAVQ